MRMCNLNEGAGELHRFSFGREGSAQGHGSAGNISFHRDIRLVKDQKGRFALAVKSSNKTKVRGRRRRQTSVHSRRNATHTHHLGDTGQQLGRGAGKATETVKKEASYGMEERLVAEGNCHGTQVQSTVQDVMWAKIVRPQEHPNFSLKAYRFCSTPCLAY